MHICNDCRSVLYQDDNNIATFFQKQCSVDDVGDKYQVEINCQTKWKDQMDPEGVRVTCSLACSNNLT